MLVDTTIVPGIYFQERFCISTPAEHRVTDRDWIVQQVSRNCSPLQLASVHPRSDSIGFSRQHSAVDGFPAHSFPGRLGLPWLSHTDWPPLLSLDHLPCSTLPTCCMSFEPLGLHYRQSFSGKLLFLCLYISNVFFPILRTYGGVMLGH